MSATATVCETAKKLIFSCSGAADVGAISDRAARCLSVAGVGKMYCLAGIGGHVCGILKNAEGASKMLAIDGCDLDCAAKALELAGFTHFEHLRLSDLGLEKGKASVNDENVQKVFTEGMAKLAD